MAHGVIYKITCLVNGKIYIDKTKQPLRKRIGQHKRANSVIGQAIRKYGWENFTVEVLEECDTPDRLNERECFWIAHFDCKSSNGYNCTAGGDGLSSPSAETIAKMKASSKRRFAEHSVTAETRAKQSATHTKRYENPAEREKNSLAQKKRFEDPSEHEKLSIAQKKAACRTSRYRRNESRTVCLDEKILRRTSSIGRATSATFGFHEKAF